MADIEKELEPYGFVRIHKKYIVNLEHVRKVSMRESTVTMSNDHVLEMSRRCKNDVLERYKLYQRGRKNI